MEKSQKNENDYLQFVGDKEIQKFVGDGILLYKF
jgi:hypothetical protein